MDSIKPFTTFDKKIILVCLFVLFGLTAFNMNISIRRGRDNLRKNDMSALQKGLDSYLAKNAKFPASINGKIAACKGPIFIPCEWGKDKFQQLSVLPRDPKSGQGREYLYLSDTKGYALYISLEGEDEAEYSKETEDKGLQCGSYLCNYGREYNFNP